MDLLRRLVTKTEVFEVRIVPYRARFKNLLFKVLILNPDFIIRKVSITYRKSSKIIDQIRILKGTHPNSNQKGILDLSTCSKGKLKFNYEYFFDCDGLCYLIGWYNLEAFQFYPSSEDVALFLVDLTDLYFNQEVLAMLPESIRELLRWNFPELPPAVRICNSKPLLYLEDKRKSTFIPQ